MVAFNVVDSSIHLSWQAQIFLLNIKKVTISSEYANYTHVNLSDSAAELYKYTNINNYLFDIIDDKQPSYDPIHSLKPVEFETLKTYIKTILVNGFIRPFKLPAGTLVLLLCKKNNSFWLCVEYQGLNNLTNKNWYLLPLIGESFNYLGCVEYFIQLYLTNAYHWIQIWESNK